MRGKSILVVEQSHSGKRHCHVVLIAAFDNNVVSYGAAWLCDVAYAGLLCAFNVVAEREECVGTQSDTGLGRQVLRSFFRCQRFRLFGEVILPDAFCTYVFFVLVDISVDDIVSGLTADVCSERQVQNLWLSSLAKQKCLQRHHREE